MHADFEMIPNTNKVVLQFISWLILYTVLKRRRTFGNIRKNILVSSNRSPVVYIFSIMHMFSIWSLANKDATGDMSTYITAYGCDLPENTTKNIRSAFVAFRHQKQSKSFTFIYILNARWGYALAYYVEAYKKFCEWHCLWTWKFTLCSDGTVMLLFRQ